MSVDVREVGRRLGADLVIEGSVRKAGSRLRITAQANETESGHYVWSETFARKFKDVFAIQEETPKRLAACSTAQGDVGGDGMQRLTKFALRHVPSLVICLLSV